MLFYLALTTIRRETCLCFLTCPHPVRPADRLSWSRRRWGSQSKRVENERTNEWTSIDDDDGDAASRLRVPTPSSVGRSVGRSVGGIDFPRRHVWVCSRAHALTAHIHVNLHVYSPQRPAHRDAAANPPAEFRKVSSRHRCRVVPSDYLARASLHDLGRARDVLSWLVRLFVIVCAPILSKGESSRKRCSDVTLSPLSCSLSSPRRKGDLWADATPRGRRFRFARSWQTSRPLPRTRVST